MMHPSYSDLIQVVNKDVTEGEEPIVNSRYSIVTATAKRARQIISGDDKLVDPKCDKPLSVAVQEVYEGKVKILGDNEEVFTEYADAYYDEEVPAEAETAEDSPAEE